MYHFGGRLLDYLTVQSPASDYKPNVDPALLLEPPGNISPVQNGTGGTANPTPAPGSTLPQTVNGEEMTVGVEGLVNINTAPWYVLASLPLLPNDIVATSPDANNNGFPDFVENLAKAIVLYRDGDGSGAFPAHGPFRSIFDLNGIPSYTAGALTVPRLQDAIAFYLGAAEPDDVHGDLSPVNPGGTTDGVRNDFEEKFLMVNRISNLITTRSDSFTVYIVVQGWRGAGTATPELVVQRRAAMILDRSNVTGVSGAADPKKTAVATD
jgi:hypothetical protein